MLLLSTAVTLAAVCMTRTPPKNGNWFYASLLFISAGAIGAFASVDAFFFYMFHELALIPTFLLIGIWGSGDRQAAAWKVTIYLAFGSFVLLIGLIGLYLSLPANDRTFDMRRIAELASSGAAQPRARLSAACLGFRDSCFALSLSHVGSPSLRVRARARPRCSMPGVLKKFGLYGILRLVTPVFPPRDRGAVQYPSSDSRSWKHSLRRLGDDLAAQARSHARLLQRDAHGLPFPRHSVMEDARPGRSRADAGRARPFHRRALRAERRIARTHRNA